MNIQSVSHLRKEVKSTKKSPPETICIYRYKSALGETFCMQEVAPPGGLLPVNTRRAANV